MLRSRTALGASILAAALAGCASSPPAPGEAAVGAAAPPAPCPRLFVSPSGQPFRGGAGGVCPLEAWFAGADTNGDGALDLAEFKADAARFFATLDVDGDGVLGPEEVRRYEQVVLPEIAGRREAAAAGPAWTLAALQFGGGEPQGGLGGGAGGGFGGGRGGGRRGGGREEPSAPADAGPGASPDGASRFGLLDEPEPVADADLNFDGRITRAEFLTRAGQRFDTLDPQQTGRLTLPALRARLLLRSRERGGDRAPERGGGPRGGHRRRS